ncbi:MAG: glycosyltransferase, partial [bacterium]|nr:glycosyltransferase [bacterium]
MKSILYISKMNLFSTRAHVYNTVKTCEALNNDSQKLTLVSVDGSLTNAKDIQRFFDKWDIRRHFSVVSLRSTANFFRLKNFFLASKLEILFTNITLIKFIFHERNNYQLIYCRDPFLFPTVYFAKYFLKKPIFFEIHAVLHNKISQNLSERLAKISNGLVVINQGLYDYYQKLNKPMIVSFCSAAEPERFMDIKEKVLELRVGLSLPTEKILLGYSGNLSRTGNNDSYGIEDIINSLQLLPEQYIFVGVGKRDNNTVELEELANKLGVEKRVIFIPWTTRGMVVKYISSFDILCIPSAGAQIGNSPSKIVEYLVSERPIVAANTSAIAEV